MKPITDEMKPAIPKEGDEETEEIPIAGRTKMTVTKNRNEPEKQEQAPVADEHTEAKTELNSILKRSPSKYLHFGACLPVLCLSITYCSGAQLADLTQSSSSPNHTARTVREPNRLSWTNTLLFPHRMWWSLTSILWDPNCRLFSAKTQAVAPFPMCW